MGQGGSSHALTQVDLEDLQQTCGGKRACAPPPPADPGGRRSLSPRPSGPAGAGRGRRGSPARGPWRGGG